MNKIQAFYKNSTFVVSFLVMVVIIQMTLGTKITNGFLFLVLFSMIIINSDSFITFLERSFKA